MKKLFVPVLLLMSVATFAGDKGNGGNSVDINGTPRLRDLVDTTVCEWRSGKMIFESHPLLEKIIKSVSSVDWYFAADLKSEISSLRYCMTGKLMKIDTEDYDSFITAYEGKSSQVAIRFNDSVYINNDLMGRMPIYDQSFLLIHEAIHSYISQETSLRNLKVKSAVRSIESVYRGLITRTTDFHSQLAGSSINFPKTADLLRGKKNAVLYVMGDYEARREIVLKSKSVAKLFESIAGINDYQLAPKHRFNKAMASLEGFISKAIHEEDVEVLTYILAQDKDVKDLAINLLYTLESAEESEVIQSMLQNLGSLREVVKETLSSLSKKEGKILDERIYLTGMFDFAKNGEEDAPFNSLSVLSAGSYSELSPKLKTFVFLLGKIIEQNDQKSLDELVFQNPDFYLAFGALEAVAVIESLSDSSPLFQIEKDAAKRKVHVLLSGFWILAEGQLRPLVGDKKWKNFVKQIDEKKLGYKF